MKLQLTNCYDIEFDEHCEYVMPKYMVRLDPNDVTNDDNVDVEHIVIAAGCDPVDGKITMITLKGKVMVFNARDFYIPDGPAIPTNGGTEIFLENISNRWPGDSPGFSVDSRWMLEKSVSAFAEATIDINYKHENITS